VEPVNRELQEVIIYLFSMKGEEGFIIFPTQGRVFFIYHCHGLKVAVGQTLFDLRQTI